MAIRTWFQHDCNARQKDGMSMLINMGGHDAYGKFWVLQELLMQQNLSKSEPSNILKINESTLVKELRINCRSLPKLMHMFSESLAIVSHKLCKTYGKLINNLWEITLPKSMIYTKRRNQKDDIQKENKKENKKEKEKEKEHPPADPRFVSFKSFFYQYYESQFNRKPICYQKDFKQLKDLLKIDKTINLERFNNALRNCLKDSFHAQNFNLAYICTKFSQLETYKTKQEIDADNDNKDGGGWFPAANKIKPNEVVYGKK